MILTGLASAPFCGAEALYWYGLHRVGPLPPVAAVVPSMDPVLQQALWIAAGEGVEFTVEPTGPVQYLARLLWATHRRTLTPVTDVPGLRAATWAARLWLSRPDARPRHGMAEWHLTFWATTLWLTRHRTAAELTQMLAERLYFGHGAVDVEAAAETYFGKHAAGLGPTEIALLAFVARAPAYNDPACHPDRARLGRDRTLRKLREAGVSFDEPEAVDTALNVRVACARSE